MERTSALCDRVLLPYQPPYDWPAMLGFLAARIMPGVEIMTGGRYCRSIALDGATGWIGVADAPAQSALAVEIHFPSLRARPQIIARLHRMFDLAADPGAIGAALSQDLALAPLVARRPGLRVPGAWDGFETAIRAILGQQITVVAATKLAATLVQRLGPKFDPDPATPGLTHLFPDPVRFSADVLATLPMPRARSAALAGLAAAFIADPLLFEPCGDLDTAIRRLKALPGLGEWTAHYIAMRALRENDAFLAADVAVQRAMAVAGERPNAKALLARAEAWRPWRAYAVLHLWTALNDQKERGHAITA